MSLRLACQLAEEAGIKFGWREESPDSEVPWVVYFDLLTGQVSFHSPSRGEGPDYQGEWDAVLSASTERIQAAIQQILRE